QATVPEAVEHQQGGGGIGAAAAEARFRGQALVEVDVAAGAGRRQLLQEARGAQHEVVFAAERCFGTAEVQGAVVTRAEVQAVAAVQQLEHGLQRVVAVRLPAGNVQEEIELGRGSEGKHVQGASVCQRSIRKVRRRPWLSRRMRPGSTRPWWLA